MYRLVAVARGEQEYFDPSGIPTATEACKSNALMRCCKDLGVASELWYVAVVLTTRKHAELLGRDPRFIRQFKAQYCAEIFAEHVTTKKKWVFPFSFAMHNLNFFLFSLLGRNSGDERTNQSWTILGGSELSL